MTNEGKKYFGDTPRVLTLRLRSILGVQCTDLSSKSREMQRSGTPLPSYKESSVKHQRQGSVQRVREGSAVRM